MLKSADALHIASAQGEYVVEPFADVGPLFDAVAAIERAFIIADRNVAWLYPKEFGRISHIPTHLMAAEETEKTLAGVERALMALQAAGANKRTVVVAIGGGIVQDVATLAAHLWYRGIDFIFVPTTLLAMSDSCIGAKSAINLGAFKNQIGTFQSPKRVLCCERFVETLPDEAVRSGYGEIVKLAMIESASAFQRVRTDLERDGFRGPYLAVHIRMSLETKRRVIEIDEYERNLRKTLNFGHTFGHALESLVDHEVPHGLAVAWGVDIATYVAAQKGLFDRAAYDDLHAFLSAAFHTRIAHRYDAGAIISAMRRDKKAESDAIGLILPRTFGNVEIVPTIIDAELERSIAEYLQSYDIFSAA